MKVLIYTKSQCPYCDNAKRFFKENNIIYEEKFISDPEEMIALKKKTGWMTFPQIFVNEKLVGGYTDFVELYKAGKINELLNE